VSWDLIAVAAAAVVLLLVLLAPSGRVQLPGFRGGVPRNALPWVIGGGLAYLWFFHRDGDSPAAKLKSAFDSIEEAAKLKGSEQIAGKFGEAAAADYMAKFKGLGGSDPKP